jgi:hypothetical protein
LFIRRGLPVGSCLLAAAVEKRRNNGRQRQSGDGSSHTASNDLSLSSNFLVVSVQNINSDLKTNLPSQIANYPDTLDEHILKYLCTSKELCSPYLKRK